jgi:glucose/arabinose dehydrogenase
VIAWFILLGLALTACAVPAPSKQTQDWRSQWLVENGFTIEPDAQGFSFPTAIAFVMDPGPEPDDPLYFVAELRGAIRVVTNDRTVHTFADGFIDLPFDDSPEELRGQTGLAGICLDPEHGYVFVTYASQAKQGVIGELRNNVVRFETRPRRFSLEPTGQTEFSNIFEDFRTGASHQIGSCQVSGGQLYVGVGDGYYKPSGSQDLDSILGKVLRMTLDGQPVPDNPFYRDQDPSKPANYVWSYGHRNPFSLSVVNGDVFVAENGPTLDRFMLAGKGRNYLWNGNEASIALNAAAVISPAVGPAQMAFVPARADVFPGEFESKFYVALAGRKPGILMLDYGFEDGRMHQEPASIVQFAGDWASGVIAGLALGPEGLYFAPLMPDAQGDSRVYRLRYDPASDYPYRIRDNPVALDVMQRKGCLGCHPVGNLGNPYAPSLQPSELIPRLEARLNSDEYVTSLEAIDRLETDPQREFGDARQRMLRSEGQDRVRLWIQYRLLEPRFDNTYAVMPSLEISEAEASIIADYLVTAAYQENSPADLARRFLRYDVLRDVAIGFVAGLVVAMAGFKLWRLLKPRLRRKATA